MAEEILEGRDLNECENVAGVLVDERFLTPIHPYDNDYFIAGQGSVGLELLEEYAGLDILIVPIGGGSLTARIATIAKSISPNTRLIGVQTKAYP